MLRTFLVAVGLVLTVSAPAFAQLSGEFEFNLFEVEGARVATIFDFDDGYTREFGIPVPVPFSIQVPVVDGVARIADGRPAGGAFVKFTFAALRDPAAPDSEENRVFLENIQIVTATIPVPEGAADPAAARLQLAAQLLREQAFPQAVAGFQQAEILALEAITFGPDGEVPGVQLVGRYVDPSIGPMLVRLTAMLHPGRPESYVTISNVNLALAPVSDGETLARTLTGRILNSWTYP